MGHCHEKHRAEFNRMEAYFSILDWVSIMMIVGEPVILHGWLC